MDMPSVDEILGIDPEWTGGLSTDEYIALVREDDKRWGPRPAAHVDRGDGWCQACGCYTPCPGSVVREPVPPVSLTRGGFILSR